MTSTHTQDIEQTPYVVERAPPGVVHEARARLRWLAGRIYRPGATSEIEREHLRFEAETLAHQLAVWEWQAGTPLPEAPSVV